MVMGSTESVIGSVHWLSCRRKFGRIYQCFWFVQKLAVRRAPMNKPVPSGLVLFGAGFPAVRMKEHDA